jgi:hypothetical protein
MNQNDFLSYLYQNNYNNVYEHALNICNNWGLAYAISNIGEQINTEPIQEQTFWDLYSTQNENLAINGDNEDDEISMIIANQTQIETNKTILCIANKEFLIMNSQEYAILKYIVKYRIIDNDGEIIETNTINERMDASILFLDYFETSLLNDYIYGVPNQEITIANRAFKYPIGWGPDNMTQGIVIPYFNYMANLIPPTGDIALNPTQIYPQFFDTSTNNEGTKIETEYIICIDDNKKKIYNGITYNNQFITGYTFNYNRILDMNIIGLALNPNNTETTTETIEFNLKFIPLNNQEINWLKTIKI